jgi:hemolysin activation/secretion protein
MLRCSSPAFVSPVSGLRALVRGLWGHCLQLALMLGLCLAGGWAQAAPNPRFDVLEFEVEGNTVLAADAVEAAILPFLGLARTVGDVEAARAALEKKYQDAGYVTVLVDLPEQEVKSGVVRLKVIEGKVSRVKVSESKYHDPGYIRARASELASGKVPNFNLAQTQLAGLNQTEDRRVQPILRPGPVPGTVEAELKVTDRLPLSFNVELNNRQVQFTRPLRMQVTGRYGNLFQEDHSINFIGIVTPQEPDQTKAFGMSYQIPLPQGGSWQARFLVSDSLVEPVGDTLVAGKGFAVGVSRSWVLPPSSALTHALIASVDFKNTRERITAGAAGATLSSPLRYMPLSLDYSAALVSGAHTTTLNAKATMALRRVMPRTIECFGPEDQFACKREEGDGSFASFGLDMTHTHPVGKLANARWRLGAQITNQPLVGAEQFAIGGVDSVRGYYEAELLGDSGVHAGLELATPNWGGGPADSWRAELTELQAYGFAEMGQVHILYPTADDGPVRLAGAGLGLRVGSQRLSAQIDLAWPLRATLATSKGSPRLHAKLSCAF